MAVVHRLAVGLGVAGASVAFAGCATSVGTAATSTAGGAAPSSSTVIPVAASINAWGSILAQLGGSHVTETSIITNPNVDPHDYEPTPHDGVVIARSKLFVENGIGYDSWAAKSLAASPDPGRSVIDVGQLVHVPDGGNPHQWYSPASVAAVADAITADLTKLDPGDASYFRAQRQRFTTTGLAAYHALIRRIRARYAGVPVGASESIFVPLARALGLDLTTPPTFLKAISEGTDPSPADLATINDQIVHRRIKVYVYNTQNATPDVAAQLRAARAANIPIATVTETLSPATASFQKWQTTQLRGLAAALHRATGR